MEMKRKAAKTEKWITCSIVQQCIVYVTVTSGPAISETTVFLTGLQLGQQRWGVAQQPEVHQSLRHPGRHEATGWGGSSWQANRHAAACIYEPVVRKHGQMVNVSEGAPAPPPIAAPQIGNQDLRPLEQPDCHGQLDSFDSLIVPVQCGGVQSRSKTLATIACIGMGPYTTSRIPETSYYVTACD